MKNTFYIFLLYISVFSCKQKVHEGQPPIQVKSIVYDAYGAAMDTQSVRPMSDLVTSLSTMRQTDTVFAKVEGKIKEVCSSKGCWMTLDTGSDKELMVRFKDYGFFMPLDAKGQVIINGKAYVSETSIEELRHYAKDAAASQLEIEAIISPEITYSFEADAVLLEN